MTREPYIMSATEGYSPLEVKLDRALRQDGRWALGVLREAGLVVVDPRDDATIERMERAHRAAKAGLGEHAGNPMRAALAAADEAS